MMHTRPSPRALEILEAWRAGQTQVSIAQQMGVTVDAIRGTLERWDWWHPGHEPEQKERRCLRCRVPFMAEGRGNWICGACKHAERFDGRHRP